MMKRSLIGAKSDKMEKSKSAGYLQTRKKKHGGKKLPSLQQRYGTGVVSSWRKGPIDLPKVSEYLSDGFCDNVIKRCADTTGPLLQSERQEHIRQQHW